MSDSDLSALSIDQFPETLAAVRLAPGAEIPVWAESSSIFAVIATATETTVVCAGRDVPGKARAHKPLTGFAVQGPLPFAGPGVLLALLQPLADEQVDVLTLSTHDTEWVLVPKNDADRAAEAWRRAGHDVAPAVPVDPSSADRTDRTRQSGKAGRTERTGKAGGKRR